jgi:hypothetical protein
LAQFLPDLPVTEDETSIKLHIAWLQREFKNSNPDMEGVIRKMDLTFPFRRRQVVEEKICVEDFLKLYPWLSDRLQVRSKLNNSTLFKETTV